MPATKIKREAILTVFIMEFQVNQVASDVVIGNEVDEGSENFIRPSGFVEARCRKSARREKTTFGFNFAQLQMEQAILPPTRRQDPMR
jgi:hypothetical protein